VSGDAQSPYLCGMQYYYTELKNGIRGVFRPTTSPVLHLGLISRAGSRDELPGEHGLAHFLEHMVFKGTRKRSSIRILNYIDVVGGELNAFTTREETCLHASVPRPYAEKAFDLIADVFLNASFPERELEKEKEVVVDEILSYMDMPDESILDEFEEKMFPGHPIGRCIQGNPESVGAFTREHLQAFVSRHYTTHETVISCCGDLRPEQWKRIMEKYFGEAPESRLPVSRKAPGPTPAFDSRTQKPIHQSHAVCGSRAFSIPDPARTGMILLNNMLGGPGNNSILNIAVRERKGLCYHIESSFHPYTDCGVFMIYMGSDRRNLDTARHLAEKELLKLTTRALSEVQLHRARKQLLGQLTLGHESYQAEMLSMGKSTLLRGSVYSLEHACRDINALTASELLETANRVLDPACMSTLIYEATGT
jgi:predicted Zn-dependent peptidase